MVSFSLILFEFHIMYPAHTQLLVLPCLPPTHVNFPPKKVTLKIRIKKKSKERTSPICFIPVLIGAWLTPSDINVTLVSGNMGHRPQQGPSDEALIMAG